MNEITIKDAAPPARDDSALRDLTHQLATIAQAASEAMVENIDYGVIPGTGGKPTLLKPGAEKLAALFHLRPRYTSVRTDLENGHREYEVTCELLHQGSAFVGNGIATCSTMESKYRWRKAERTCPECGKAAIIKGKADYGGGWLCWKKKDGCGAKFNDGDQAIEGQATDRVENPDIADTYNTVLKMSEKRALVAAVLNATAASQTYTQDVEDFGGRLTPEAAPPTPAPPPAKPKTANDDELFQQLRDAMDQYRDDPDSVPDPRGEEDGMGKKRRDKVADAWMKKVGDEPITDAEMDRAVMNHLFANGYTTEDIDRQHAGKVWMSEALQVPDPRAFFSDD